MRNARGCRKNRRMPGEHGRDSRDIPKETIKERMHDNLSEWTVDVVLKTCVYMCPHAIRSSLSTFNTIKLMPNPNKVSMCTVRRNVCD